MTGGAAVLLRVEQLPADKRGRLLALMEKAGLADVSIEAWFAPADPGDPLELLVLARRGSRVRRPFRVEVDDDRTGMRLRRIDEGW